MYFQSKLKKPVMTKRASVSASSNKSPTPGLKSLCDSTRDSASKSDSGSVARSQRLTPASALESPIPSTGSKSPPDSPSRRHSPSDSFSASSRRLPVDVTRNPPTDDASRITHSTKTIPVPLNLPDANIIPLRITKRSPLSPPSSLPANRPLYQSFSPPPPISASQPTSASAVISPVIICFPR